MPSMSAEEVAAWDNARLFAGLWRPTPSVLDEWRRRLAERPEAPLDVLTTPCYFGPSTFKESAASAPFRTDLRRALRTPAVLECVGAMDNRAVSSYINFLVNWAIYDAEILGLAICREIDTHGPFASGGWIVLPEMAPAVLYAAKHRSSYFLRDSTMKLTDDTPSRSYAELVALISWARSDVEGLFECLAWLAGHGIDDVCLDLLLYWLPSDSVWAAELDKWRSAANQFLPSFSRLHEALVAATAAVDRVGYALPSGSSFRFESFEKATADAQRTAAGIAALSSGIQSLFTSCLAASRDVRSMLRKFHRVRSLPIEWFYARAYALIQCGLPQPAVLRIIELSGHEHSATLALAKLPMLETKPPTVWVAKPVHSAGLTLVERCAIETRARRRWNAKQAAKVAPEQAAEDAPEQADEGAPEQPRKRARSCE